MFGAYDENFPKVALCNCIKRGSSPPYETVKLQIKEINSCKGYEEVYQR